MSLRLSAMVQHALAAITALCLAAGAASANPRELTWDDLMPEGEHELLQQMYWDYMAEIERQMQQQNSMFGLSGIEEGSAMDQMVQIGTFNTVDELDGEMIRLPGFVVPFDFSAEGEYSDFLLVPYFGACIHSPPPPPNQIVYVHTDEPVTIESTFNPVWVEGVLSTQRNMNGLGDAAYSLKLDAVETY